MPRVVSLDANDISAVVKLRTTVGRLLTLCVTENSSHDAVTVSCLDGTTGKVPVATAGLDSILAFEKEG